MKVVEGPLGAPIAHCFGLKHVENGDKIYHHIAIASVWHLFWESGTNFRRIEAVPIYDSASVALYIHASCSCPTRCTHVLLGFKGVKGGQRYVHIVIASICDIYFGAPVLEFST